MVLSFAADASKLCLYRVTCTLRVSKFVTSTHLQARQTEQQNRFDENNYKGF